MTYPELSSKTMFSDQEESSGASARLGKGKRLGLGN